MTVEGFSEVSALIVGGGSLVAAGSVLVVGGGSVVGRELIVVTGPACYKI